MAFARSIGFASALACCPLAVLADEVVHVHQDWRVVCRPVDKTSSCRMLQTLPAQVGGDDVFLLSVEHPPGAQVATAVVSVPLGVYLAPGIAIHIAGQRPFKALYEICDQTSCHAGFVLKGPVLQAFKRGSSATFRVWTEASKAVEFPVSLNGFTASFADLGARRSQ